MRHPILRVILDEYYEQSQFARVLDTDDLIVLEPMRLTDMPVMAFGGEMLMDSTAHVQKFQLRKQTVEIIAREIAEKFMELLETRDTFNGYPLNKGETTDDKTRSEVLTEKLEQIADIAHKGGSLGYSDIEVALREIRKLTSGHWK